MQIRSSTPADLTDIEQLLLAAFNDEGPAIARLVNDLLNDPTARPALSLVAIEDEHVVGHILFSRVTIPGHELSARILAPLAILPTHQKHGIGGALIREGLHRLEKTGTRLVFVLGHTTYYPRFGFEPALPFGLNAPYPIPPAHSEAWMVQALNDQPLEKMEATVCCADALANPEYWGPDQP